MSGIAILGRLFNDAPGISVGDSSAARIRLLVDLAGQSCEGASVQERLMRSIYSDPGCTLRQARDRTGLNHRDLLEHVRELEACGFLFLGQDGNRVHLLPGCHGIEECWRQVVAMRNPALARLHAFLRQDGSLMQAQILNLAELTLGWTPRVTARRLALLAEAGLASRSKFDAHSRAVWHRGVRLHPVALVMQDTTTISIHHEQQGTVLLTEAQPHAMPALLI